MTAWANRIVGHEDVEPDQLLAHPQNARRHPAKQLDALDGSLATLGWLKEVIVNTTTGHVLDGHARIQKAMQTGSKVPVTYVKISEKEELLALATLDKISEMATYDDDALNALLADVPVPDDADLKSLLAEMAGESGQNGVGGNEDEAPEPPVDPITKKGDLWILGTHRLLCGDATKAEDVSMVMGDERAGLMNTDPPYGVSYANNERPNPGVAKPRVAKPRVANDDLSDAKLQAFLESAFKVATGFALRPNAAWYMWHAHLTQGYFAAAAAAAAANVILHRQIIWVKPVLLLTRGQYHWKHEPCFMGWVKGNEPPDYGAGAGERNQTTVWEVDSINQQDRKEFNHSSPKPIGLFEIPIIKHLKPGEVAFEPFAGSGPQFIAAEKHGRRCFGLELEPRYCDVIKNRWEQATGKTAELERKER